jgi:hypothetical protein
MYIGGGALLKPSLNVCVFLTSGPEDDKCRDHSSLGAAYFQFLRDTRKQTARAEYAILQGTGTESVVTGRLLT